MDTFPGAGLPGNSHKSKQQEEPPKAEESTTDSSKPKFEKVVTGKARPVKRTLGSKIKSIFLQEGVNYKQHVVENIVIPKIQEMALKIVDSFTDGIKESFYEVIDGGKQRSSATVRPGTTGRVNYQKISANNGSVRVVRPGVVSSTVIAKSNVVREIVLENSEDGHLVIAQLKDAIARYGHVTVGDLYVLIDYGVSSTDHEWGWSNVDSARVRPTSGGQWRLMLPGPEPIG